MHTETITATVAGGVFNDNTNKLKGEIRGFEVKPPDGATYDIRLIDSNSIARIERLSKLGAMSDKTAFNVNGFYTVAIDNATVDGTYIIELELRVV